MKERQYNKLIFIFFNEFKNIFSQKEDYFHWGYYEIPEVRLRKFTPCIQVYTKSIDYNLEFYFNNEFTEIRSLAIGCQSYTLHIWNDKIFQIKKGENTGYSSEQIMICQDILKFGLKAISNVDIIKKYDIFWRGIHIPTESLGRGISREEYIGLYERIFPPERIQIPNKKITEFIKA